MRKTMGRGARWVQKRRTLFPCKTTNRTADRKNGGSRYGNAGERRKRTVCTVQTLRFFKVRALVPQLFELNGGLEPGQKAVDVLVRAHREETASVPVVPFQSAA
jgi:hypothetical protein